MRRTAFEHVDNRDVLPALKPDRLQRLREKLTALPDKRLPLEIFFRARRFTDHHDRAARGTVREHGAGPCFTETAAVALREKRLQLIPGAVCHLAEEFHRIPSARSGIGMSRSRSRRRGGREGLRRTARRLGHWARVNRLRRGCH